MRVVCVKWGPKYGAEWVVRLKNMVAEWLPCPHDFICYTEAPVAGVRCEPLPSDLPGWWAKVGLFRNAVGETLYLDLDVVIRGSIASIPRPDNGKVWAIDDFSYGFRNPRQGLDAAQLRLLGGNATCNSSVLYWHGDAGQKVWDDFTPDVMGVMHGDQNWISNRLWPDGLSLFEPGIACSYKYHVIREDSAAPIVVFHGDPKPNALHRENPLRKTWEAA